ncbi:MAG: C4-type zinc ribbon domain-containing protein [Armatimonadetes bacterium]|nr:C4-type zinc ribbon domain-containing protein [Armatimonadota bacterium]
MNAQMTALYELQNIDLKITKINALLAAMNGARDLRKQYSVAKAAKESAEKMLLGLDIDLKDSELKLKTIDDKRANMEKRLYAGSISNPKELAAIEKEIKMLKDQQGQLDPRVLDLYDEVESAQKKVSEAAKTLEEAERVARAAIKKESVEKARLEVELAELSALRDSAAEKITDHAILTRYDAIRKKSGSTGVAMVIEGKCEGCHVAITSFIIRNLYAMDDVQYCENCGRMLILDV